jgi:hypothetical protein
VGTLIGVTGRWTLVPPQDFDDADWAEAEVRGVLLHVFLDHDGRRFPAIVYDSYRIVQDADLMNESAPESVDWTRASELGTLSASLGCGEQRFPVTFFDLERFASAVGWDDLDDLVHDHGARRTSTVCALPPSPT